MIKRKPTATEILKKLYEILENKDKTEIKNKKLFDFLKRKI